jgi:hypothetical protein
MSSAYSASVKLIVPSIAAPVARMIVPANATDPRIPVFPCAASITLRRWAPKKTRNVAATTDSAPLKNTASLLSEYHSTISSAESSAGSGPSPTMRMLASTSTKNTIPVAGAIQLLSLFIPSPV